MALDSPRGKWAVATDSPNKNARSRRPTTEAYSSLVVPLRRPVRRMMLLSHSEPDEILVELSLRT